MKKKLVMLALAVSLMAMTACGNQEEAENEETVQEGEETAETEGTENAESTEETESTGPQYLSEFTASDYVTLGEYKGVEISLNDPEVTEEYLDSYIEYVLQNSPVSTPVTGRAVETGDVVDINYVGKIDGEAFDGGTGQTTDLTIGSGQFIDGFEDGVIGMEIGETKDVDATFPDPYKNNPDLAGKAAVFTVTLNGIYSEEIPELTDEYVAGLGVEDCTTVEEYRDYCRELLMEEEQNSYDQNKTSLVMEAIAEQSEFEDAPAGMVDRMSNTMLSNISSYANMYGVEVGEYVAAVYGGEAADYEETVHSQAQAMAQRYVMLQAIADQEDLTVSDDEMEEQLADEAASYGYEDAEAYKELIDVEAYREYLMTQKVLAFIADNAVVTAAAEAE